MFDIPEVTFSEENAMQDNTDVPQGSPIFASRPITRLKAKQSPRREVESIVLEEVCYNTKEINDFPNLLKQTSGEYVWEWILKVQDKWWKERKTSSGLVY